MERAALTIEEIERRDKRTAAIHEAGHLTAAVALGKKYSRAELFKLSPANPIEQLTWGGRVRCIEMSTTVAVAGGIASWTINHDGEFKKGFDDDNIDEFCWMADECGFAGISAEDRIFFPPKDQVFDDYADALRPYAAEALTILKTHKAFFDWIVTELIEFEYITDGDALDKFAELYGKRAAA